MTHFFLKIAVQLSKHKDSSSSDADSQLKLLISIFKFSTLNTRYRQSVVMTVALVAMSFVQENDLVITVTRIHY